MIFFTHNKAELTFRKWTHKAWAVFNSIGKTIRIGVLCTAYALGTIAGLHANNLSDTIRLDLSEVEVAAHKALIEKRSLRVAAEVDENHLKLSTADGINDVVNQFIDARKRGPADTQADLSIRGGGFDQVAILLNGTNISNAHTGHYSANLPIDHNDLSIIQIMPGAASRLYGQGALSGALQMATSPKDTNLLSINLNAGAYAYLKGGLRANFRHNNYKQYISAAYVQSDGYRPNTDFQMYRAFTHANYQINKWNLAYWIGFVAKDCGANAFYGTKYDKQFDAVKTTYIALNPEYKGRNVSIQSTIYFHTNADHYLLNRTNPALYENYHQSQTYGADLKVDINDQLGKFTIQLSNRNDQILSTTLGLPLSKPRPVSKKTEKEYTKYYLRTFSDIKLEHTFGNSKFNTSIGTMLSLWEGKMALYPGIDLRYAPHPFYLIFASVNRAMRLPTFTDLFYAGPINQGNADLQAENAMEYEIGASYKNQYNITANISLFHRSTNNAIDWVWIEEKWHTKNYTQFNLNGGNIHLAYRPNKRLHFIELYYEYLHGSKVETQYLSNYALDYLKHNLSFSLRHQVYKPFSLTYQVRYKDRNGEYLSYDATTDSSAPTSYKPYATADIRLNYSLKHFEFFLIGSTNICKDKAVDIGGIPLPDYNFHAGISWTL